MIALRSILASVLLIVCLSCSNPAEKLPVYDRVPDFSMVKADGTPFTASQMDGSVWVVDFVYTTCPAECPRMSSQMRKVADHFKGSPTVRFLSVSVDPERDTPAALRTFAARWGAPTSQWQFITGTAQTVHLLANTTFHVGDVINVIEHSTKFALVDKRRRIRGYYSSFDPESLRQLRRDMEGLARLSD